MLAPYAQTNWAAEEASSVRVFFRDALIARQTDYARAWQAANDGQLGAAVSGTRLNALGS